MEKNKKLKGGTMEKRIITEKEIEESLIFPKDELIFESDAKIKAVVEARCITAESSLVVGFLEIHQEGKVKGNLKSLTSIIVHSLEVDGDLECGQIMATGSLKVGGNLNASGPVFIFDNLVVEGDIAVRHSIIVGEKIDCKGTITTSPNYKIFAGLKAKGGMEDRMPIQAKQIKGKVGYGVFKPFPPYKITIDGREKEVDRETYLEIQRLISRKEVRPVL